MAKRRSHSAKVSVWAALAGNLLVAATKAVAAAITGSSAMLSETVHSLVDTINEILLLYGMKRAQRKPDDEHPFGHGREIYFWSFVVSLLIFALGSGVSLYEGVQHILDPRMIEKPGVSFIVLGFAFLFEGGSWWVANRQFRAAAPPGEENLLASVRASKNPPAFITLFEDSAALLGIVVAACATSATVYFQEPLFDGVGSILIGLILGATAAIVARESKSLLIGEPATETIQHSIRDIAGRQNGIVHVNGLITVHLGPEDIVAMLSLEFRDELTAADIEEIIIRLERDVRKAHADVSALFVKPQTPAQFKQAREKRQEGGQGA